MGGGEKTGDPRDLVTGALLQIVEAVSLGMPLEVWKTRQGSYPKENCVEAFRNVWNAGGVRAFWKGGWAKVLEAGSKGAVLLYSKDIIMEASDAYLGVKKGTGLNGAIGGAGGGVCQTAVMSPLTLIITYKLKNKNDTRSIAAILREMGLRKAYGSAPAMAMRQASNWALRQGLADAITTRYQKSVGGRSLTAYEKITCGVVGGALSCVNQPTEVLRIQVQARHSNKEHHANTRNTARLIYVEHGIAGFWTGLVPRMMLAAYQTVFMVTIAAMVKDQIKQYDNRKHAGSATK